MTRRGGSTDGGAPAASSVRPRHQSAATVSSTVGVAAATGRYTSLPRSLNSALFSAIPASASVCYAAYSRTSCVIFMEQN